MSDMGPTGPHVLLQMTHEGKNDVGYILGHVRSLSGFFFFAFFPHYAFLLRFAYRYL